MLCYREAVRGFAEYSIMDGLIEYFGRIGTSDMTLWTD